MVKLLFDQICTYLKQGIHPLKIADGFELSCELAVKRLEECAEEIDIMANDY